MCVHHSVQRRVTLRYMLLTTVSSMINDFSAWSKTVLRQARLRHTHTMLQNSISHIRNTGDL